MLPKTTAGKAVSSLNAVKHGVLSSRLFLADELPDAFQRLQDGLREALRPIGHYELLLVERMAVTIWRQRRLIRAEAASIELQRQVRHRDFVDDVQHGLSDFITAETLASRSAVDPAELDWCIQVLAEIDAISDDAATIDDLAQRHPLVLEQLQTDAADEGQSPIEHLAEQGGIQSYADGLASWCRATLERASSGDRINRTVYLVTEARAAPIGLDTLPRYTAALDNELVKIARELREAQAWRCKTLDAEPATSVGG